MPGALHLRLTIRRNPSGHSSPHHRVEAYPWRTPSRPPARIRHNSLLGRRVWSRSLASIPRTGTSHVYASGAIFVPVLKCLASRQATHPYSVASRCFVLDIDQVCSQIKHVDRRLILLYSWPSNHIVGHMQGIAFYIVFGNLL